MSLALRPDPAAAAVPRLAPHGSTGSGGPALAADSATASARVLENLKDYGVQAVICLNSNFLRSLLLSWKVARLNQHQLPALELDGFTRLQCSSEVLYISDSESREGVERDHRLPTLQIFRMQTKVLPKFDVLILELLSLANV
uniref:Uncharacterized protein n=1 Tax=Oryza punctata TaxID=4537 RepID=A0A0E0M0T8_ORYPU